MTTVEIIIIAVLAIPVAVSMWALVALMIYIASDLKRMKRGK